jgi:hypothetical protein
MLAIPINGSSHHWALSRAALQRFTVRETSPGINYGDPDKPLYWHWSIEARSATAAEAMIRNRTPAAESNQRSTVLNRATIDRHFVQLFDEKKPRSSRDFFVYQTVHVDADRSSLQFRITVTSHSISRSRSR